MPLVILCFAGETEAQVQQTIQRLASRNVGSILDFAAEDDGSRSGASAPPAPDLQGPDRVVARQYPYEAGVERSSVLTGHCIIKWLGRARRARTLLLSGPTEWRLLACMGQSRSATGTLTSSCM